MNRASKQPVTDRRVPRELEAIEHRETLAYGSGYRAGEVVSQRVVSAGGRATMLSCWGVRGESFLGADIVDTATSFPFGRMIASEARVGPGFFAVPASTVVQVAIAGAGTATVDGVGLGANLTGENLPPGPHLVEVACPAGTPWWVSWGSGEPVPQEFPTSEGSPGSTGWGPIVGEGLAVPTDLGPVAGDVTLPQVALAVWVRRGYSLLKADLVSLRKAHEFCLARQNYWVGPVEPDRFDAWLAQASIAHELIPVRGSAGWGLVPNTVQSPRAILTTAVARDFKLVWARANDRPRAILGVTEGVREPIGDSVPAHMDNIENLLGVSTPERIVQIRRAINSWLQYRQRSEIVTCRITAELKAFFSLSLGDCVLVGPFSRRGEYQGSITSPLGANVAVSWDPILVEGRTVGGGTSSEIVDPHVDFIAQGVSPGDTVSVQSPSPWSRTIVTVTRNRITFGHVPGFQGSAAEYKVRDTTPMLGTKFWSWNPGSGDPVASDVEPVWDQERQRVIYRLDPAAPRKAGAVTAISTGNRLGTITSISGAEVELLLN